LDETVEVWSGGVNTWECDEMGHLNVRFWVAKAMEALAGLSRRMGMPDAFARSGGATLLIRDLHMRFLREAQAGACLWASGGVVALGEADADLLVILRHADGTPAATFRIRAEHATASDLRPFPWPGRIRAACEALAIEVPDFAAPRSIDLSPLQETRASLAFAEANGMTRIGLGTVRADELDVFGRMRPEMFIGRVSDGVARLFGQTRPGPEAAPGEPPRRIGGAVLEYRVAHHGWPVAGDHVEVRSGFADCNARTRRVFHWMLDPVTGLPWASAEAVVISFDLDARKVVDITEAAQEEFRRRAIAGIGL
jgi:acyl-CoA thioester hydrolase